MALSKRYDPETAEPRHQAFWEESGVYRFSPTAGEPVYSIDTPPATVSGHLHLGHAYSYSHADFLARFWRMNGCNVFYPIGYDDNGLPTERLVEKRLGISAAEAGRKAFIEKCLELFLPHVTEEIYQGLFAAAEGSGSIHRARWPMVDETLEDSPAEVTGDTLVTIATAVRHYKSENNLPLGTELGRLQLATGEPNLIQTLQAAYDDLMSITRAQRVEVVERLDPALDIVQAEGAVTAALSRS